jgi:hypothetical protein
MTGEQSPLWHLCGNIWHQELAAHPLVGNRLRILQLLAAIATGRWYRDVHGNRLNEPNFAERRALVLRWVEEAHEAVARGVVSFLAMTWEETDVRLAAAHVYGVLSGYREVVCVRLPSMVNAETRYPQRAGLLLFLGLAGDRSKPILTVLTNVLSGDDLVQRRGATLALAYLKPGLLPELARAAILDAIAADDLADSFRGLPWDVTAEADRKETPCMPRCRIPRRGGRGRHRGHRVWRCNASNRFHRPKPDLPAPPAAPQTASHRPRPFAAAAACGPRHGIRDGGRAADILRTLSAVGLPKTAPGWPRTRIR